jgi:hypothetical protein
MSDAIDELLLVDIGHALRETLTPRAGDLEQAHVHTLAGSGQIRLRPGQRADDRAAHVELADGTQQARQALQLARELPALAFRVADQSKSFAEAP